MLHFEAVFDSANDRLVSAPWYLTRVSMGDESPLICLSQMCGSLADFGAMDFALKGNENTVLKCLGIAQEWAW